jgi:hypothetical protein
LTRFANDPRNSLIAVATFAGTSVKEVEATYYRQDREALHSIVRAVV